jgi:hypothetical protein
VRECPAHYLLVLLSQLLSFLRLDRFLLLRKVRQDDVLVTVGDDTTAGKSDLCLWIAEVELNNLVERVRDIEESLSVG